MAGATSMALVLGAMAAAAGAGWVAITEVDRLRRVCARRETALGFVPNDGAL